MVEKCTAYHVYAIHSVLLKRFSHCIPPIRDAPYDMAHMISIYDFRSFVRSIIKNRCLYICHLNILLKADIKLKPSAVKLTLKLTKGPTQYIRRNIHQVTEVCIMK